MSVAFAEALLAYAKSNGIEGRDDGAKLRDLPPKPCSARLPSGDWCLLAPGHDGECAAALPARLAIGTQNLVRGLMRCPTCGVSARPLHGHLSVHFPSVTSTRPCPNSWPASRETGKAKSK